MALNTGRLVGKLTARFVETVKKPGLYGDGGGLYLNVQGNSRSWIARWSSGGSVRKIGLGPTHTVTLALARERAAEVRLMLLDGVDPREARRRAAKPITFDAAAAAYIEAHRAAWKTARLVRQWESSLATYVSPVIGKLPVSGIDVALVLRVLSPIWTTRNATACQLRGRIEAILSWARVHNYRTGENPAIWRGNLDHLLPKASKVSPTKHHAALPYGEIPAFMGELRDHEGVAARAFEFAILTAARTGEVLGAKWSEVDLNNKLWTVPAERMKAGKAHRVPLSDRCMAILADLPRTGELVFPSRTRPRTGLTSITFRTVLSRLDRTDVTGHGFRSTFRDWAAETTNFQNHIIEMALAHVIRDQTEAAYRRGDLLDKRRLLMAAWGEYCARPVNNVIALRS